MQVAIYASCKLQPGGCVLHLMVYLCEALQGIADWSEGCECHECFRGLPADVLGHLRAWCRKMKINADEVLGLSCVFAGMRAPELAAGALQSFFTNLGNQLWTELQGECISVLTEAGAASVVKDFELGRSHIFLELTQKLDTWLRLPWRLAALAHLDGAVARAAATSAMAEFDRSLFRRPLSCAAPSISFG